MPAIASCGVVRELGAALRGIRRSSGNAGKDISLPGFGIFSATASARVSVANTVGEPIRRTLAVYRHGKTFHLKLHQALDRKAADPEKQESDASGFFIGVGTVATGKPCR